MSRTRRNTGTGARLLTLAAGILMIAGVVSSTVEVRPAEAAPRGQAEAPPRGQAEPAAVNGPVGWDTYRDIGALPNLRAGATTKQFSSYDRSGGNDDGFEGTYSCLRNESDGRCVIAEDTGPGEVGSIWFTYAPNTVSAIGTIRIELDGRTVLDAPLQDVVDGRLGAPFTWPLVGNSRDTMGGSVIKVPMPYRSSMKITTQNNPHFYHVAYREFAEAAGVRTFDPSDPATDVVDTMRRYGIVDPKPEAPGASTERAAVDLAPGRAATLGELSGPGQISQLRLRVPQATASPNVVDDGRAYGRNGGSSFTVAVDPANEGVRLTRRYDRSVGNQRAAVTVDGSPVGEWRSGPPAEGRWGDQVLPVPASVSAGKSSLSVDNRFISSDIDVNEFRYDVHSRVDGQWVRTDVLDVGPNNPNDEAVHGYAIRGGTFEGLRPYRYRPNDAEVAASDALLSGLRLRISFDGQTTVDAPIGAFFGSGLGKYEVRSLMSSVDTTENGAFTSWWPMPYAEGAKVELVNGSDVPVSGGSLEITSAPDSSVTAGLAPGGPLGYFTATHRRADTVNGQDWNFLTASGRGISYGVSHAMRGLTQGDTDPMNFLEGDEKVYVDGARRPAMHGTGTEDFYESGWYFQDFEAGGLDGVPYDMPLAGAVGHELREQTCPGECMGAYRTMLAEAIPFDTGLRFDIEHGPASDQPANYESVAYWYRGR